MSGTSVDGLDIALCTFNGKNGRLTWEIAHAETKKYPPNWSSKLLWAHELSSEKLAQLHFEYGELLGKMVDEFIEQKKIDRQNIDGVSSHGHTVFHQPEKGMTLQIGHGAALANACKLPVICDFRAQDVAMGGHGAPLVPIGDRLLFGEYNFCLNIGGIANISFELKDKRLAWDICPANMVLNHLSQQFNQPYDEDGEIAASGKIDTALLDRLNRLGYYSLQPPKTLGREWVEKHIFSILEKSTVSPADQMATFVEHIAHQIAQATKNYDGKTLLITGGGARNKYLSERINKTTGLAVVLPEDTVIDFKEALIFALLGYLKMNNEINILSSVTGARHDHVSGIEYKI